MKEPMGELVQGTRHKGSLMRNLILGGVGVGKFGRNEETSGLRDHEIYNLIQ